MHPAEDSYNSISSGIIGTSSQQSANVSSNPGSLGPTMDTIASTGGTSTSTPTSTPTPASSSPFSTSQLISSSPAPVSSYLSTYPTSLLLPSSSPSTPSIPSSTFVTTQSTSPPPLTDSTTTVVISTVLVTSVSPLSSSPPSSPSTSTYTITTIFLGQDAGTTTDFVASSVVLSTESPVSVLESTVHISPGTVAAIVLGIVGAFAFSSLWLFCARRRRRKLVQEAVLFPPVNHTPRPLCDEILDVDELGYGTRSTHSAANFTSQTRPAMEERYAGILAALHLTERLGKGNEGGSTGGIYGSRRDTASDMDGDDDITRVSSPTFPPHGVSHDTPPYLAPLSPPPPVSPPSYNQTTQPTPPPAAYYVTSRRKSSPGPDAAAWLSGYSVAPSYTSHYARSQTLGSGSGSGSGSVDALTRTRTGSEEPLLGIGKVASEATSGASTLGGMSPTSATDHGNNRVGLGSAFGSPAGSTYSPSSVHPPLQHDTSGSYDARTVSGSGSYRYARSGTQSSVDLIRSVSSQGALSSAYSHGQSQSHGFRFGFSRPGSLSSGSTGKRAGSGRHSFGVPPTSFRAWKDRVSTGSDKEKLGEKQSIKEEWRERTRSPTASNSGSLDEKHSRGSPVVGVRALLGRLRRGHTPSPHSSIKDFPSPTKASMDVDLEKAGDNQMTPPPIQIQVATPQRRRFSFILSNPDPHPPSPYSGTGDIAPSSDVLPQQQLDANEREAPISDRHESKTVQTSAGGSQATAIFPTGYMLGLAPSPAPTEESRLAEGLLHPRLRTQGCSDASLRDFEDYSRPIGGVVKNRLYSTTTFGTQDDTETRSSSRGTLVQDVLPGDEREHEAVDVFGAPTLVGIRRDSWLFTEPAQSVKARHSRDEA